MPTISVMSRVVVTGVLAAALLAGCGQGTSAEPSASGDASADATALAESLVDEYAAAVFERDQEALSNLLSDAYVLRRSDGSGYDKQGYVDALADGSDYELVDYRITDVTAKRDGDILVATFWLDATIEENGRQVTTKPSPSLVTFVQVDGEWKLASDGFFSE